MPQSFQYDTFAELRGHDLCCYMEPLLQDSLLTVPHDLLQRLLAELDTYDEYHLVYAILLGCQHEPEMFIPHVPKFLCHRADSVHCAAINIINHLDNQYITDDLVESVRQVYSLCPERGFLADTYARLEQRYRQELSKS